MSELLLTGIGHLTTNVGDPLSGAAIRVMDGIIEYVGPAADAPEQGKAEHIDCGGRAVIPGFVDAHTHLVFAGERSREFALRMGGASYEELAAGGGGILSTVEATRAASEEELVEMSAERMSRMIATGTTTLEIKSGYGLDTETELTLLHVARRLGAELGITVKTTFLGAHSVPRAFAGDRAGYVRLLIEEMLPAVAGLADFCDVFVEEGVFNVDEARQILVAAEGHGMRARVHAEQIHHTGGAQLAAELGAASADHLDKATPEDAAALAASGVAAVLVPGASFSLRAAQAPGPMIWDAGCTVALATDCNPGTSYFESMAPIVGLAVIQMGLRPDQAIWAATRGGALALGLDDRGIIEEGAPGDLVILDAPGPDHIPYRPATNLVARVIKQQDTKSSPST